MLGYYYEGLWNFCIAEKCMSLHRDWAYKVFVLGFLNVGTFSGFLCNLLSPLLWVCGKKEQILKGYLQLNFPVSGYYVDWNECVHRKIHSEYTSGIPWVVLHLGLV
ncbi:Hypothetical predicted protein [Podarcis lilfordi]|uniref:Uncharacterized protein n=1 Tax=Podarcis lilfordi TaxID=74358 RepID=A0AA35KP60_9SAUR|nr:Hypothetical predicted protein [Podarcis lilfordi]